MRTVPERSALLTASVLLAAFVAGPLLGLALAGHIAPDSTVAQVLTMMVFPLAFFGGAVFWLGLGLVSVIAGALPDLVRGRRPYADTPKEALLVPPGCAAFAVLSVTLSGLAAIATALLSSASLASALPAYLVVGGGYGTALWWLARHGYLPFDPA